MQMSARRGEKRSNWAGSC